MYLCIYINMYACICINIYVCMYASTKISLYAKCALCAIRQRVSSLASANKQIETITTHYIHTYLYIYKKYLHIYIYVVYVNIIFIPQNCTFMYRFSRATLLGVYFSHTLFDVGSFVAVRLAAWALLRPLVNWLR